MSSAEALYFDVSSYDEDNSCYPGCNPDSNCYPCDPCGPDTVCNPRGSSDEEMDCYPCSPCNPDTDSRCYPCSPCIPDARDESEEENGGGSSGCFLTSACVEALGLPDDCEELQTLRVLRDKRRLYDDAFDALVRQYYEIAPRIVRAIDALPERRAIYRGIYDSLVLPCVQFVRQNRENEAIRRYTQVVLELQDTYLEGA